MFNVIPVQHVKGLKNTPLHCGEQIFQVDEVHLLCKVINIRILRNSFKRVNKLNNYYDLERWKIK